MKKSIQILFVIVLLGALGWGVYDFIGSNKDTSSDEDEEGEKVVMYPEEQAEDEFVESDEIGIEQGELAPDFELESLKGEKVKLSDYKGEKVMINFWATWCPPCREEMPDMQKFHEDTDVKILAVNLTNTESSFDKVPEFIDERDFTFSVLMDEESEVANEYKIAAYPTSYMIDTDGRIQFKAMGAIDYDIMIQEFEKME